MKYSHVSLWDMYRILISEMMSQTYCCWKAIKIINTEREKKKEQSKKEREKRKYRSQI